jgi:hypothetical protein
LTTFGYYATEKKNCRGNSSNNNNNIEIYGAFLPPARSNCSPPDLNREHRIRVLPAGPQPQRTSEDIRKHVKKSIILLTRHMSLQDLPLQLTERGRWELKKLNKAKKS